MTYRTLINDRECAQIRQKIINREEFGYGAFPVRGAPTERGYEVRGSGYFRMFYFCNECERWFKPSASTADHSLADRLRPSEDIVRLTDEEFYALKYHGYAAMLRVRLGVQEAE